MARNSSGATFDLAAATLSVAWRSRGCRERDQNTPSVTARFVREAFVGTEAILGPLHPESYVLVQAADGHAHGYGGRTQEARLAEANPG